MSTTFPVSASTRARRRDAGTPAAAAILMALLARLDRGLLELHAPDGSVHRFGPGGPPCDGTSANAGVLRIAPATVKRHFAVAKLWLHRQLRDGTARPPASS